MLKFLNGKLNTRSFHFLEKDNNKQESRVVTGGESWIQLHLKLTILGTFYYQSQYSPI